MRIVNVLCVMLCMVITQSLMSQEVVYHANGQLIKYVRSDDMVLKKYAGNADSRGYVRINDQMIRKSVSVSGMDSGKQTIHSPEELGYCISSLASNGQEAPGTGGGVFSLLAFTNPTTINATGQIAFNSQVLASTRNQGVFMADTNEIRAIVIGCGLGGGSLNNNASCGDPSPVGGNFSGLFYNSCMYTPAINDAGDVLFISDVYGGSSPRGLFLYQSANQQLVKIAAVGDVSPLGGIFSAVGMGSINNEGKVVFMASRGSLQGDLFMWENGVVSKLAAVGDPAPGGGSFSWLVTEYLTYEDGSEIPSGPVPDINDLGQVCFKAIVAGGSTERGIIVRTDGVDEWYVRAGDNTPAGGNFIDLQAASINNSGEIAFFADLLIQPSDWTSGWFAGKPENWRKVIVFGDPVDGGTCSGLAYSRNPMQTIDEEGNVLFWTDININGGQDRLILGKPSGDIEVIARKGSPCPTGGIYGSLEYWPSVCYSNGTINASLQNAGTAGSHLSFSVCNVTGTLERKNDKPTLEQNVPNPCTSVTAIDFTLTVTSFVTLKIINILGEDVATLISGKMTAGTHQIRWDASNQTEGVYMYCLQTDSYAICRKLILNRR